LVVKNSAGQTVADEGIQVQGADYSKIAGSAQISVPPNDTYTLQAVGTGLGPFQLVIRNLGGTQQLADTVLIDGIAGPGSVTTYQISSTSAALSAVVLTATFSSTFADIRNSLQLGLVAETIANSLLQKIDAASKATGPARANILNAFINEVNAQAGKHITGVAVDVLIQDANSLLKQATVQ
jgi:hypothetical protein